MAGGAGLLTAAGAGVLGVGHAQAATTAAGSGASTGTSGTPEQIHLTWGNDPATSVVVSWASPGPAGRPRVRIDGHVTVPAVTRTYTDGINGETVWAYHARIGGLRPGTSYSYTVTADNDANAGRPFAGSFRTAPAGRVAFRFTSFGDLATPNTQWVLSYGQSAYAVGAVESFRPLFHLLNGDLCYADLNPTVQPEVWRDFGNNNQASAAFRPWMPCPGNHEVEFDNGPQGYTSYLTRYLLPDNGIPAFRTPRPPPKPATAQTQGSARRACRCSTSSRSTWWCAVTTTTTSGRSRSAVTTAWPVPKSRPGRRCRPTAPTR